MQDRSTGYDTYCALFCATNIANCNLNKKYLDFLLKSNRILKVEKRLFKFIAKNAGRKGR